MEGSAQLFDRNTQITFQGAFNVSGIIDPDYSLIASDFITVYMLLVTSWPVYQGTTYVVAILIL